MLSLLSWCAVTFSAPVLAVEKLNFQQAVDYALKNSPAFDAAKRVHENTQLEYSNSISSLLPSVDVRAQHQYALHGQTTARANHEPWSNSLGLFVSENLYDNGEGWRKVETTRLQRKMAAIALEEAEQTLLKSVAKAYFDYSSAVGVLDLQRRQYDLIKKQFDSIRSRYRGGVSSNRDFLRIETQLKKAELAIVSSEVAVEDARADLALAIGEPGEFEYQEIKLKESMFEALPPSELSVEETRGYQLAELGARVSDIKFRSVQRDDWPRLSLTSSYSYLVPQYLGERTAGLDVETWEFKTLLTLEYSLWDWGQRRRNVEKADNQRRIENSDQEQVRQELRNRLKKLSLQMNLLSKSYVQTRSIFKGDEKIYEILNFGYRDGKVSYLDLVTGLGDMFRSRSELIRLQFSLLSARTEVAFYKGTVNEVIKEL